MEAAEEFDLLSLLHSPSGTIFISPASTLGSSENELDISTQILPDLRDLAKMVESLAHYSIEQLKQSLDILGINQTFPSTVEARQQMKKTILQQLKANYEIFLMMLTVKDLKKILSDNNMKVSGKKEELVDRLVEAVGLLPSVSFQHNHLNKAKKVLPAVQTNSDTTSNNKSNYLATPNPSLLNNSQAKLNNPLNNSREVSQNNLLSSFLGNSSQSVSSSSSLAALPFLKSAAAPQQPPLLMQNRSSLVVPTPKPLQQLQQLQQVSLSSHAHLSHQGRTAPDNANANGTSNEAFDELDLRTAFGFVNDDLSPSVMFNIKRKRANSPAPGPSPLNSNIHGAAGTNNYNANTGFTPFSNNNNNRKPIGQTKQQLDDETFRFLATASVDDHHPEEQDQSTTTAPATSNHGGMGTVVHEEEPHFYYDYSDTELNEILRTLEQNIQRDYDRKVATAARKRDMERQASIAQYREYVKQISLSPVEHNNDGYTMELLELSKKCENWINKINETYEQEKNDLLAKQADEIAQLNVHFAKFGMLQGNTAVAKINSMKSLIKAKEEHLYEREVQLALELEKLQLDKQNLELEKKFLHQFENETTRFDEIS